MRKLKFHEQKLLKKVDFLQWKNEHNLRELQARSCLGCHSSLAELTSVSELCLLSTHLQHA